LEHHGNTSTILYFSAYFSFNTPAEKGFVKHHEVRSGFLKSTVQFPLLRTQYPVGVGAGTVFSVGYGKGFGTGFGTGAGTGAGFGTGFGTGAGTGAGFGTGFGTGL
jgi:hypothetical protein